MFLSLNIQLVSYLLRWPRQVPTSCWLEKDIDRPDLDRSLMVPRPFIVNTKAKGIALFFL